MSGEGGDNIIGVRTVYDALLRLEGKVDTMGTRFDTKIDDAVDKIGKVEQRQDYIEGKLDGSIGLLKWIGPTGIVALVVGMIFILTHGTFTLP